MDNSHKFFENRDCRYFPCHLDVESEGFNCLFCFCPLYFLENCGGAFTILANGIKDCSDCVFPHRSGNYEKMLARINAAIEKRKA